MLSLGSVALGIGLICWASFNILAQSAHPAARTALPANKARPSVVATESNRPSEIPSPDGPVYPARPAKGEVLGTLSFPVLKQEFPIIEGTGTQELKKGVGHMAETAMPGEADNCVLSGHRDTVFSQLGRVRKDDQVIVRTAAGTFTYKIRGIRIVHKDDRTVVVPADHAVLTVSTCYPFNYVGPAPDRYVLIADLVGR